MNQVLLEEFVMLINRFREHFRLASTAAVGADQASAFVPCPMFAMMSWSEQSRIHEIYRLAAELTREQLAPPRIPACSVN